MLHQYVLGGYVAACVTILAEFGGEWHICNRPTANRHETCFSDQMRHAKLSNQTVAFDPTARGKIESDKIHIALESSQHMYTMDWVWGNILTCKVNIPNTLLWAISWTVTAIMDYLAFSDIYLILRSDLQIT